MAQISMFPEEKTPELTEHDQPMAKSDLSIQPGEMLRIGKHELHCGDCVHVMKGFPDNSIDCISALWAESFVKVAVATTDILVP